MIRKTAVFVVIVGLALPAVSGIVAGDDKWGSSCDRQTRILDPGKYTGTLGPGDRKGDSFYMKSLDKNDYYTVRVKFKSETEGNYLETGPDGGKIRDTDGDELTPERGRNPTIKSTTEYYIQMYSGEVVFRVYSTSTEPICFGLDDFENEDSSWAVSFARGDDKPPQIGGSSSNAAKTITALKSTIAKQKTRINELEAQLQKGGGVTIQVTVSPEGDSQSFIQGESAVVSAKSANADLSKMEVKYKGNTYSVDNSGTAAIPLTGAGEQKLTFAYQGVTKSVTLSVASRSQDSTGATAGGSNDGDIIPVSGPGFGSVPALIAIILLGLGFRLRTMEQ